MFLYTFILFILYEHYKNYIIINRIKIILATIILPVIFVVLLITRENSEIKNIFVLLWTSLQTLTLQRFINLLAVAFESFKSFEILNLVIHNNFIHIESGIIRIVFMFISRDIWQNKPEAISRIISKEFVNNQYLQGGGTVATIYGDAYINGGIIGIIIILLLLGVISKVVYNTCILNNKTNKFLNSVLIMFYSLYIFDFIFYARGFFSEFYWKSIISFIVFIVLIKLLSLKILLKRV